MSLPSEKIAELKQIIHQHLNQVDIRSHVEHAISQQQQGDNEHDLLKTLEQQGLVDSLMKSLNIKQSTTENNQKHDQKPEWIPSQKPQKHAIDPGKQYIFLQLLGGKAFLEHLQDSEPLPGHTGSTFTLHILFAGQRFHSQPVPCLCEPAFNEGFLLEVLRNNNNSNSNLVDSHLTNNETINIVLIKNDTCGEAHLVSTHRLQWRGVLCAKSSSVRSSIEMNGVGPEANIPVGIIEVRLDFIPKLTQYMTSAVVTSQLNLERSRAAERDRLFLAYTKQWWREYLQIRPSHAQRLVKIFAQDDSAVHRFVCSYIRPLRGGRLIETPRHAARFVSLFGYTKHATTGGVRNEMWTSLHAFLARGQGDTENHCILLCSLLLGFGLNAYVAVGNKQNKQPHAWVVTLGTDGSVMFWESLTATRYVHTTLNANDPPNVKSSKVEHSYRTIGCLFNHESFYANSQPTDDVRMCSFDVTNQTCWKAMNAQAIKSVATNCLNSPFLVLRPPSMDVIVESQRVEDELKYLVLQHRLDLGLTTKWDDELGYLLSPALSAYEFEHCHGVSVSNEDFQHAVRRNVPDGHTFKGFPIQFVHRNTRRAFATCLRASTCEEILHCRGDQVNHAVRVRVYAYSEQRCALWIMFAVKYKSVL